MNILYLGYFGLNFCITLILNCVFFVDRIGHINFLLCKAKINLPIKNNSDRELEFFPQNGAISDLHSLNSDLSFNNVLYEIIYKLYIFNYIIELSSLILSTIGLIIVHFVDQLSLILVITFSVSYLLSILVLTIVSIKVYRLQHKTKK